MNGIFYRAFGETQHDFELLRDLMHLLHQIDSDLTISSRIADKGASHLCIERLEKKAAPYVAREPQQETPAKTKEAQTHAEEWFELYLNHANKIFDEFLRVQKSPSPEKTKSESYNQLYEEFVAIMESINTMAAANPELKNNVYDPLYKLDNLKYSMYNVTIDSFGLHKPKEDKKAETIKATRANQNLGNQQPHYAKMFTPSAKHHHVIHQPCSRGFKR